eukprot:gene897-4160_t
MDKKDANELPIQCRSLNYYGHTLDFFSWEEEVEKQVKEEMQKIKENSASDSNVKRQVENQQESDQHRKRSKHDSGKKSSTTDKVGQDSSTKGNFEEQREISAFVKRRDASQSAQLLVKTRATLQELSEYHQKEQQESEILPNEVTFAVQFKAPDDDEFAPLFEGTVTFLPIIVLMLNSELRKKYCNPQQTLSVNYLKKVVYPSDTPILIEMQPSDLTLPAYRILLTLDADIKNFEYDEDDCTTETLMSSMRDFASVCSLPMTKLKFIFDGDAIFGTNTPAQLDIDIGEPFIIDVHIITL